MNNVKAEKCHEEAVRDISFAPSDIKFASASDDQTIRCGARVALLAVRVCE